ncbi:GNAT family N-acetyltransferase [Halosegnis sp.]|uniref:GNAT family N-acetyltransferase n=1 Tax=Halosegnis sp. TaxID=2864959 RepID=UPI0035D3DE9D
MIRDADPTDADLIAEEFWYPLAKEMEAHSPLNELTDDALAVAKAGFADLLTDDERYDFLLEEDGTCKAYLSAECGERPTRVQGRYLALIDLYVKEPYRREGHATALLEHAETVAATEDYDFITVEAEWENTPARRVYEARGYTNKQVEYTKRVD